MSWLMNFSAVITVIFGCLLSSVIARQIEGCGINPQKSLDRRIVGGKPAGPNDWPWMAAILTKENDGVFFCGGVLITERHVLTAAHCLTGHNRGQLIVRLGEYDFRNKTSTISSDYKISEIISHPQYNLTTHEHDIAILKLNRPSLISDLIKPVCLPTSTRTLENHSGYVVGWGAERFGRKASSLLREVILPVWDQPSCENAYPGLIKKAMMCAGYPEGGKDSCQGDSGGPYLTQIFPSKQWLVVGIVSWGRRCGEADSPGIYTRVDHYINWVLKHIKDDPVHICQDNRTSSSNLCDGNHLDAVTQFPDGDTYVFRGEYIYRLDDSSGIKPGFPQFIPEMITGIPSCVDAAFESAGATFVFKGSQVWKFINARLQSGYPRQISREFPGVPSNVDAALIWGRNNRLYFFKDDLYWRYGKGFLTSKPGVDSNYPKTITSGWPGVPPYLDGATVHRNGYTYFFKGKNYYRYNDESDKLDELNNGDPHILDIRPNWYNC